MKTTTIFNGLVKTFIKEAQQMDPAALQSIYTAMQQQFPQQFQQPQAYNPNISDFERANPLETPGSLPSDQMNAWQLQNNPYSINWMPKAIPGSSLINQLTTPWVQNLFTRMGLKVAPEYNFAQAGGVTNAVQQRAYDAQRAVGEQTGMNMMNKGTADWIKNLFLNDASYNQETRNKYLNDAPGWEKYKQEQSARLGGWAEKGLDFGLGSLIGQMNPESAYGVMQKHLGPAIAQQQQMGMGKGLDMRQVMQVPGIPGTPSSASKLPGPFNKA